MNLITCIFVSHHAIACLNSLVGSPSLECINVKGISLCVDQRADVGCLQETFKEEIEAGSFVLDTVEVLNDQCITTD